MYNQPPADADQLAQMRHLAILQRRASPPRCNPISILVLVMSLGMVFIGLTMTVIAHWPGSTSIGENPLKIAGPILLSVGGTLFIIGLFLVCFLNRREKRRWEKSFNNMAQSRINLNQSASSLPGTKGVNKDGEKSGPSIGGSHFENTYPPPPTKLTSDSFDSQRYASYNYTEDSADNDHKMGLMRSPIESYGATTQRTHYSATEDPEQDIPDPIRTRKKKKTIDSSSENLNATEREELLNKKMDVSVRNEDYSLTDDETFNLSVEGDANIPAAVRKKKKKNTKSSRENLNAPESDELLNSSRNYQRESHVVEESSSTNVRSKGHRSSLKGETELERSNKPAPTSSKKVKPAVPSKPTKQGQQQPPSPSLRVHVRTQPGATVHIHQGSATPPLPAYAQVNKSTASGETDL